MLHPFPRTCVLATLFATFAFAARGDITITELPDRVRIEIDGQLFTEYRHVGAPHVYFYPLIGPGGVKMTRSWPMEEVAGEERDHPHHRSLWFSHGLVNGGDFWTEAAPAKAGKHPVGAIVHEAVEEAKGGPAIGTLRTRQKWVATDGTIPLTSTQTLRLHQTPATERLFDFEVRLTAGTADVVLGDTKEGSMAIRIAESMRLKLPGGKAGAGHIVNSAGDRDGAAWGKRAAWVSFTGPVDGKTMGITIFDHPKNLRHPTRWHARDYGLFAANPWCENEMDKTQPPGTGDYKMKAGESLLLRYRVLLHQGDSASANLADRFLKYTQEPAATSN